jgi:PelA/Pel-15E family pectate lyase
MKFRPISWTILIVVFGGGFPPRLTARAAQAANTTIKWLEVLKQKPEWYAGADALRIADNVLLFQRSSGGWPKNLDMAAVLTPDQRAKLRSEKTVDDSTIDNSATYTQLMFLAQIYSAQRLARHQRSFLGGIDYLLRAQYANGGWPQYFPIREGYYQHITFNDDAMIGVMRLLRDVASGHSPYRFVDGGRRRRAARAVARGVECILRTQIIVHGRRTVWCAQHDEKTLGPASARTYEPVSLSGQESVGIVRFLMQIDRPDARVIESIRSALAWFKSAELKGIRWVQTKDATKLHGFDHVVVADSSAPPLWARFYEIETNRPIFSGRDSIIKYNVAEIDDERRNGYRWYTEEPARLLEIDYPAWQKRVPSAWQQIRRANKCLIVEIF